MPEEPDACAGDDGRQDSGVDLAERERERSANVSPAIAQTPAASPSMPVEEVDHVHDGHDPHDRQRHPDPCGQVDDAEEREGEVVDPHAEGARDRRRRHLPGELRKRVEPAEVVDRADDARDGGPEHDAAHLAREVEERERRDEDPEEDREPAEPRDRPLVEAPRVGLVDDAEQAGHPADRRREQDDDAERDQRAPEDLGVRAQVFEHARALLRAVQAVACVAEPGHDVALLVERAVDRRHDDRDVGMVAMDPLDPLGRGDQGDQPDGRRARAPSPSRPRLPSSCRSRASGRAGSRRGRRCRSGSFT